MATIPGVRAAPAPMHFSWRPPILDEYIVREMMPPFLFAIAAFLLFQFINLFFLSADYIINAHASPFLLLRYLIFRVPIFTPFAFPFACLTATLLGIGRLAADNELQALRTSGARFLRIAAAPLGLGVAAFAFSYYINETIVPKSIEYSTRTFYQIVYHTQELPIVPQFFRKDDATGRVFYVGDIMPDHKTMKNVMIFENAINSPYRQVTNADTAIIQGATLHLIHARIARFKATGEYDGGLSEKTEIDVGLPLGETADQFLNSSSSDPYMTNSKQLATQIKTMQAAGQGGSALDILKITLAQKLAAPFAAFIAVLLAMPLAASLGKKGRTIGIALSILLLFVYYLMMSAFAALGKNGALNPYFAAWLPNLIMLATGGVLFYRVEH
jgi:lipopolysaccharide export system permease protein